MDFCKGNEDFDKSHFAGIFSQDLNKKELLELFQFFPSKDVLVERMMSVKSAGDFNRGPYLLPNKISSSQHLVNLVQLNMQHKCLLSKECGDEELCEIISKSRIVYLNNHDKRKFSQIIKEDNPSEWFFELIGDLVGETRGADHKLLALEEACYSLAANYYLAWYIMSPALDMSIYFERYFESYFDIWRNGGKLVMTSKEVYVTSIDQH